MEAFAVTRSYYNYEDSYTHVIAICYTEDKCKEVIEKDKDRCRILSEQLNSGLVLCGDGTDIDLLTEEGITEADCVVCLTDDDKLNLLEMHITFLRKNIMIAH